METKSGQEAKAFEEAALKLLRGADYRITMPRVLVVRAFAQHPNQLLSAYRIHELIVTGGNTIDVVSVYRILETLADCHVVRRVSAGKVVLHVGIQPGQTGFEPVLVHTKNLTAEAATEPCILEAAEALRAACEHVYPHSSVRMEIDVTFVTAPTVGN